MATLYKDGHGRGSRIKSFLLPHLLNDKTKLAGK